MAGAALALLVTFPAAAAGPEIPDAEVAQRLAFIEARLMKGERSAKLWWHIWYGSYLGLTVGQGVLAGAINDKGLRADMGVGAVTSALGAAALGIFDFPARHAGSTVRALPAGTPVERRAALARAEKILEKAAEGEAFGRSWISHVAGIGVAGAATLVLALAYKRGWSSLTTLGAGIVVTELQIWTQPTAAIDDWKAYTLLSEGAAADRWAPRPGAFRAPARTPPPASWQLTVLPGGVGVVGTF
jgi:hypothetical protein